MATRAPLTLAERQYILTRRQAGVTLNMIADELDCSVETIRKWEHYSRQGGSPRPRGRPRKGVLSTYPEDLVEQAVALKRAHPHWGPANVTLDLKRQPDFQTLPLPSAAGLSTLFKERCPEAVQPRQHQQYPDKPPPRARTPHQRWQMDGKEKVPLGDHEVATVLNIRDPAAALMIGSRAIVTTTDKAWRKVTLSEVQDTLRAAFTQWGRPLEIQTDHEVVYTGCPEADFPSLFTLWLVGLGIAHVPSRDRRPTDQAHVERSHRTLGDMSWKDEHFDQVEQLQAALNDRCHRYNYELPVRAADCDGRPPLEVHPEARHSGRPFHPDLEWELFDLARVDAYLAQRVWTRHASDTGLVSIGSQHYYLGRAHHGVTVSVRFLPDTRTFRFQLADGTLVNELPARGLDQVDLIGRVPLEQVFPMVWQLPLPLEGV